MKVVMLTYSTRPRGGVVHALKLAERIHAFGEDVTLYSLARSDDHSAARGYFREVSVPYMVLPYEWHPDLLTRLERMIESYSNGLPRDADIYHAQDCVGGTALARMKTKGTISAPIFRTIHHVDDFAEPRLYDFEKKAVANAEHRFVVSKYWQNTLKTDFGYESIITYNGLDASDFAGLPRRTSTRPTVLFVGGLEPRKGLEYLIHAMETIAARIPESRLIAVAKTGFRGTDEWGWFKTLGNRLGLDDHLEFHESVSQDKLLEFYSECDVLALPSKTEGWGLSLMEAMACGKPVVATRVGGVPELVRDGVDGILVAPGDVRSLAESLIRLLEDSSLRSEMGKAGRNRVLDFSWDATARIVMDAYLAAINKTGRTRS